MPPHIPPGREDLWRRQEESDARLARLEADSDAAEKRRNDFAAALGWDDPLTEDADRDLDEAIDAHRRETAVNDRIYSERLAGLSSWIDSDPTAPICPDCQGTGGPPGHDAHGACRTCRGWGREDRPPILAWSKDGQELINPATGRSVDILAGSPAEKAQITKQPKTTTPSGGTVSSIEEAKAEIMAACDRAQQVQGPIQQAAQEIQQVQQQLMQVTQGTSQADAGEAIAMLQQAEQQVTDAGQMVMQATQAAEGVAQRL